jgi:hypothetical protein
MTADRLAALLHENAVGCTHGYGEAAHAEGHKVHGARLRTAGVTLAPQPASGKRYEEHCRRTHPAPSAGGNRYEEREPELDWTDDPMREARRIAAMFPDGLIAWLLAATTQPNWREVPCCYSLHEIEKPCPQPAPDVEALVAAARAAVEWMQPESRTALQCCACCGQFDDEGHMPYCVLPALRDALRATP